ncbi:Endopolyphosphatase [Tolypocladium paradoxum]|uniref:Endopolyphosphatase n=1 Tax=Tolypocladium paradoxum TaxID=94208 RepID=A0A2S4KM83_9HYPO|nr:Endopolyphosphatase [Tolypocladium paradoxum]
MARAAVVWLRLQLVLALSCSSVTASPAPAPRLGLQTLLHQAPQAQPPLQQRRLHGRFLHITDFHPDEFYTVHSSSRAGVACHRGKGMAGTYGAETTDCDSPFSLVDATLGWIEANIRDDIDFVVWTGDSARHDSDERHPRTVAHVLDSNRAVADKFVDAFGSSRARLAIPVIPNFGNNDFLPHNIMRPGPNKWFHEYSDIWKRFIPEEQRHSFEFGGWFYVEVVPAKLAVFSLNTMYFFDRNAAVDGCADPSEPGYKHMEWLRVQLQRMRDMGMKAILMGHVPPARTDSKQNWDETCWQRYTLWLQQYRDVVTASLYGHMNIDHFLLQDTAKIDLALDAEEVRVRSSMEEDVTVQSKGDYLQELRAEWSDLPGSALFVSDDDDDKDDVGSLKKKKKKKGKKHKYKKIGGKYAERFQLSLVSPSVVPNYLPTLRVFEYNITGLDQSAIWKDSFDVEAAPQSTVPEPWGEEHEDAHQELRRKVTTEKKKKKKKNGHKGKKGKKRPEDPGLIIPDGPPKDALPGPAYYPQPFTLTGYVQYFANLTYINNDIPDSAVDGSKWRGGNPEDRSPKHKPPQPRTFRYEVEYSTFDDKVYKLPDLTVKSYLNLAYRMGVKEKGAELAAWDDCDDDDDEDDVFEEKHVDDDVDGERNKGEKKRQQEENKTWLHFLGHAFVKTVPLEDLEKM